MTTLQASKQIDVRFSEVDSMNVVWHGSYALYFEDAREAFGAKYGLEYMTIAAAGCFAPLVDLSFRYLRPIVYGMHCRVDIFYRPTEAAKIVFDYEIPTSVPAGNALTEAARRDLYQDTVNETLFMMPAKGLVTVATVGDASAIDGALNGLGAGSQLLGRIVGITQNGLVRTYAAYILGGVILALAIVLGFRL